MASPTPVREAQDRPPTQVESVIKTTSIMLVIDGQQKRYNVTIEAVDEHGKPTAHNNAFSVHEKAQELIEILAQEYANANRAKFTPGRAVILTPHSIGSDLLSLEAKKDVFRVVNPDQELVENEAKIEDFADKEHIEALRSMLSSDAPPTKEAFKAAWTNAFTTIPLPETIELPEADEGILEKPHITSALEQMKEAITAKYGADENTQWLHTVDEWDTSTSFTDYLKENITLRATLHSDWIDFKINTMQDLWKKIFNDDDASLQFPRIPSSATGTRLILTPIDQGVRPARTTAADLLEENDEEVDIDALLSQDTADGSAIGIADQGVRPAGTTAADLLEENDEEVDIDALLSQDTADGSAIGIADQGVRPAGTTAADLLEENDEEVDIGGLLYPDKSKASQARVVADILANGGLFEEKDGAANAEELPPPGADTESAGSIDGRTDSDGASEW